MDIAIKEPLLWTISNLEMPAHPLVRTAVRKSGTCRSNIPCVYEVQVNEVLITQKPSIKHVANNTFEKWN